MKRYRKSLKLLLFILLTIGAINTLMTYVFIPHINRHQSVEIVSPTHWLGGGGFYGSTLIDIHETDDGHVHTECWITIKNLSSSDQDIYLAALMPYEMLLCVNKSVLVYAKEADHVTRQVFHLEANQEITFQNVIFCDESNGNLMKMNRLCPWVIALQTNSV